MNYRNLFCFFAGLFICGAAGAQSRRPNIIFIISDDHAYQAISAYGSKLAQTPNIDRIGREGAIFTRAMVTNSICGPSRATLLTGIGKWHLGNLPRGFDYFRILRGQGEYYNPDIIGPGDTTRMEGYVTDLITKLSTGWLDGRDTSKPFCLIIGEKATHREWLPDIQDLGAYDSKDFPLPSTFFDSYAGRVAAADQDMTIDKTMRLKEDLKVHADYGYSGIYNRFTPAQKKAFYDYYENKISQEFDTRHDTGRALVRWKYERYLKDYLAVARSMDRNIGQLLEYLDRTGLARNTVVVYCSDQGFYMGEHGWFDKRWMYEPSLRTPFLMRWPGVIKPGSSVSRLMLNIDWAPTMLDIAGVRSPEEVQGTSFLPLVKGDPGSRTAWRKAMYYHYYEYPQPHHVYPHFGVRTERYKLVRFYGPSDSWELYDLVKDPDEVHNLYGHAGYEQVTAGLKSTLKELIREYKDQEAEKILEERP